MTITAKEIKDLNVDGGVEEIVLKLLAEIDALKAALPGSPHKHQIKYVVTYDDGSVETWEITP